VAKPIVEDGMENETILEVREKDGLLIHQGVIRVPYTWAAGAVASRFYAGLRDRRILGIRCPRCRLVMVPPKKTCHRCFGDLNEWVEVGPEGTLQTFTVVHYSEPELHPLQAPFAYGIIKLDGADAGMTHLIAEANLQALKEGMRMTAVFKEKPEGNYLDIRYFKPLKGAK
jgi:uncharacterized OB-fold protein